MKLSNLFTAIASLVLGVVAYWNGSDLGIDPKNLVDTIQAGDISAIVLVLLNLFSPLQRIISDKLYVNLEFLKSRNFLTQSVTVILTSLSVFVSPEISADGDAIGEAIASGEVGTILAVVVLHFSNFINHKLEKK